MSTATAAMRWFDLCRSSRGVCGGCRAAVSCVSKSAATCSPGRAWWIYFLAFVPTGIILIHLLGQIAPGV